MPSDSPSKPTRPSSNAASKGIVRPPAAKASGSGARGGASRGGAAPSRGAKVGGRSASPSVRAKVTSDDETKRRESPRTTGGRPAAKPSSSAAAKAGEKKYGSKAPIPRGRGGENSTRGLNRPASANKPERAKSEDDRRPRPLSQRGRATAPGAGGRPNTGRAAYSAGGRDRDSDYEVPKRKGWGSVARKGAAAMRAGDNEGTGSKFDEERSSKAPERAPREEWIKEKGTAKKRPLPKKLAAKQPVEDNPLEGYRVPDSAIAELQERVGPKRVERMTKYLKDAARAYASERWGDARKSLRPLMAEAGDAPAVQELNGMLLYRTGKWAAAIKELHAAHMATQSFDLYPAIMDCHRALKQHSKVDDLWEQLREASPGADVMAEGRIVEAESLASRDRLTDGIALLEKGPKPRQLVHVHHLRTWYVLADLYDRAGETGKARTFFERVAAQDEEMGDVLGRLAALD